MNISGLGPHYIGPQQKGPKSRSPKHIDGLTSKNSNCRSDRRLPPFLSLRAGAVEPAPHQPTGASTPAATHRRGKSSSSVFAVALPRFTGLGLACSCRGAGTGRPRPSGSRRGSAGASPSGRPRPAWRCAAGHQRRQQQRRLQTRSALKTATECHAECFSIRHVSDR